MRRFVDESDPMCPVERIVFEAGDRGTPEADKQFKKWSRRFDVNLTLKDYRATYEKTLAEVNNSDKNPEHLARRRADLSTLRTYIDFTEKALENRQWKAAVLNGIQLGIAAHKALRARPLEPEVITGKQVRGGGLQGNIKVYGTAEELGEEYAEWQTKMDALHKRRPSLTWTELSNRIGEQVGKTGRYIRLRCTDPHKQTGK